MLKQPFSSGSSFGDSELMRSKFHLGIHALLFIMLTTCRVSPESVPALNSESGGALPPPSFTRGLIVTDIPRPVYPSNARSLGVEGWVSLRFSVDQDGLVIRNSIEVLEEEPTGYFERSALLALRQMRFENTSTGIVDDVQYVFRYELEDPVTASRNETPQIRELIPNRFITPNYPAGAEADGIEGFVEVSFTVTTEGEVEDIEIVESNPGGVFDQEALLAAERLRFEPRLVNGTAVRVENVTYRFDWRLPR